MSTQDKVRDKAEAKGEVLDDKDKYIIRGGHVYVKTEKLLQSPKVKQQIRKLREFFG